MRHASPLVAGLALLPELAMATIASALSGRAIARRGPALPMVAGLAIGAFGLAGLIGIGARTPYGLLVPALVGRR